MDMEKQELELIFQVVLLSFSQLTLFNVDHAKQLASKKRMLNHSKELKVKKMKEMLSLRIKNSRKLMPNISQV
jgi:hypothetical protein